MALLLKDVEILPKIVTFQDRSVKDSKTGIYYYVSTNKITRCQASKIPSGLIFRRAGVIPYTYIDGEFHYCMGIDSKFNELTDFGGGVERGEDVLTAATRELYEESLGVFDFRSDKSKYFISKYSHVIYTDRGDIIFFVLVDADHRKIIQDFDTLLTRSECENKQVVWLSQLDFEEICANVKSRKIKMYDRVRDVIAAINGLKE